MTLQPTYLAALGRASGPNILGNEELSSLTGIPTDAIFRLTGVASRSYAPFEDEVDLAVRAVGDLFARLPPNLHPDLLLLASTTGQSLIPSTAMRLSARLFPKGGPPSFDIGGSCAAFMTGLFTARSLVASGSARRVLLVNTERKTRHICPVHTPETALLFGDGASAAWVSDTPEGQSRALLLREVRIGAYGKEASLITYAPDPETGRKLLRMDGQALFRQAVRIMSVEIRRLLSDLGIAPEDAGAVILHQANGRILDGIAKRLGLPAARLHRTVAFYGNTSSASLGITLENYLATVSSPLPGPLVLGAIGGGITWGVGVVDPL